RGLARRALPPRDAASPSVLRVWQAKLETLLRNREAVTKAEFVESAMPRIIESGRRVARLTAPPSACKQNLRKALRKTLSEPKFGPWFATERQFPQLGTAIAS